MEKIAAIIVAGGRGKRMGTTVKKQFIKLRDKEVLAHTIEALNKVDETSEISVGVGQEDVERVREEIVARYGLNKVSKIVVVMYLSNNHNLELYI